MDDAAVVEMSRTVAAILAANSIVLAGHVNPDGDSLGSVLGLAHALKSLGKDIVPISCDGVPAIYEWMPGSDWIVTGTDRRDFELAIVCDAGALERVGRSVIPAIQSASTIIDVDHHVADGPFGDIRILDASVSATAELIWLIVGALEAETRRSLISRDLAVCLMTGLITDTGSFKYRNVTPRTFELAAALLRLGAIPDPINERVFENRSFSGIKLLGRALDSLQVSADGKISWAHVTKDDFLALEAGDVETEGIVNHVRSIVGVQIGILFREVPGQKVRISMRAREGADVNKIAQVFGGGGHRLASGCSLDLPLAECERIVIAETCRQLSQPSEAQ